MIMIRSGRLKPLFLLLLILALAGCATLGALGDASTPLDVYNMRSPGGAPLRDVVIELPTTSRVLQLDPILIRPNPLQARY